MTSIYLAGKIGRNDWRHEIVGYRLRGAWPEDCYSYNQEKWPVIKDGVLNVFDYVGPYFIGDDHGCGHGANTHGCGTDGDICGIANAAPSRPDVVTHCLQAIDTADIFFAWLDNHTAYGTLVELGYARARGKKIYAAGPTLPETFFHGYLSENTINDLWFAFTCATELIAKTPREALEKIAEKHPKLESPIEQLFWTAHQRSNFWELAGLRAQVPVLKGRYRIDFALPDKKIGIELDGYAWHSSKEVFTKDRERQRDLELDGWRIIRFSGTEVNANPDRCVAQAAALVRSFNNSPNNPAAESAPRRPGAWPVPHSFNGGPEA